MDYQHGSNIFYVAYSYDALNRITAATGGTNTNYDVSNIGYDKNGNIQNLTRNGFQGGSNFAGMDVLDYDYDSGNKLLKVADTGNKAHGFIDGANSGDDFVYDGNGNLEIDRNKGITEILYNHLNLQTKITVTGTNSGIIDHVYGADGTRLKKTISTTGAETLYANGYVYEGNTLQFFPHPEGYVTPNTSGGYDYVYQFKDHVDNIRLSYTDANGDGDISTDEIIKESNFYPYGLSHRGYNGNVSSLGNSVAKRFMFGSKELDESLGLGTYDFGARNYDPAIGRWMNIDPLAEQMRRHSPYNYAFNNPIFFLDPDGMMPCPTGDCDSFFAGMAERAGQFNQDLADRAERFVDDPVKSINKGLADTGGFLADVTNISGILGEENQLYNGVSATADKVANFSNLSEKEKGSLVMGGVLVVGELLVSKKTKPKNISLDNKKTTDFVVTSNGTTVPIPDGASGPVSPQRGSGMLFQGGSGGKGMSSRTTGVRIMDANANQGRRASFMNRSGQTVDPSTGRTIPNNDPRGHIPIPIDPEF